jgi:hypothetical protein
MKIRYVSTVVLVLVFDGVSPKSDAGGAEVNPPPPSSPRPSSSGFSDKLDKKIDWKNMNLAQRKSYMKKAVLPAMQTVFAEYDAQKYPKITCYVCHGDGVSKGYEMPNGALLKLPTDMAGWRVLQEKKPEVTQFMANKVKPRMAALLGEDEWTAERPDGFGCYSCHAKVGGAATGAAPPGGATNGSVHTVAR